MTKFKFIPLIASFAFFSSCSEEEPIIEYVTITETVVETVVETQTVKVETGLYSDSTLEGKITDDLTLDSSKIWLLKGRVSVVAGVTLTIPAGTIIKAAS